MLADGDRESVDAGIADSGITQTRSLSRAQRLTMVEHPSSATLSLRRQCQLLEISRSSLCYQLHE